LVLRDVRSRRRVDARLGLCGRRLVHYPV
jgi:hypothetical protein